MPSSTENEAAAWLKSLNAFRLESTSAGENFGRGLQAHTWQLFSSKRRWPSCLRPGMGAVLAITGEG